MAYAIYYFKDKAVEVGNIKWMQEEDQRVASSKTFNECPNLEDEDSWLNVNWRPGQKGKKDVKGTFPAKILMISDNYTDLCKKREAFIKGENIWEKANDKRKRTPNSKWMDKEQEPDRQSKQLKKKKTSSSCLAKEASNRMIEDLKKDLMEQQALESLSECDETSDEELESPRNWSSAVLQIKQLKSENKRLQRSNYKHILDAIRELPAVVQNLRDITEQLTSFSSSPSVGSTPGRPLQSEHLPVSSPASPPVESDMVSLVPGSDIKVNKQKLNCLRTGNSSVYIGDLAVLIFGRETLASSSLTGRQSAAHKDVESKPQLDAAKLDGIVGHAQWKYPSMSVQDVRKIIRKKCNNENFRQASTSKPVHP